MPIASVQSLVNLHKLSLQHKDGNERLRVKTENGRATFYFTDKAPSLRERLFGGEATKARAALRHALQDIASQASTNDAEAARQLSSIGGNLLNAVRKSGYKHALRPDEVSKILSPIQKMDLCRSERSGERLFPSDPERAALLSTLKNMGRTQFQKFNPSELWSALKSWPAAFVDRNFLTEQHAWCLREVICAGVLLAKVEALAENSGAGFSTQDWNVVAASLTPPEAPAGVSAEGFEFLGDYAGSARSASSAGATEQGPSKADIRKHAFVDLQAQKGCSELQKSLVSCFSRYVVGDVLLNAPDKPRLRFLCKAFKEVLDKDEANAEAYKGLMAAIELGLEETKSQIDDVIQTDAFSAEQFILDPAVAQAYRNGDNGADWRYLYDLTKAYWTASVHASGAAAHQIYDAMRAAQPS